MRLSAIVILIVLSPTLVRAEPEFLLKDGQRVVFLGDSNTFAGGFIAYIDAYLYTRFPERKIELINLGLPSETVTGLSEPDHPYPRPDIHTRLDRALELTKPNLVIACYGMNDGIYYPFNAERFEKYQAGIHKLIEKCENAGAKVILMSPSPFDPKPLGNKVLAKGADKYSWMKPYEKYDDEVLTKYSQWLLTLREKKYVVVDAHHAVLAHLQSMRKIEPAYRVSGDGIHPNASGHAVIAMTLLAELKTKFPGKTFTLDFKKAPPIGPGIRDVREQDGEISFTFTAGVPFPYDPKWHPKFVEQENAAAKVNPFHLQVLGRKETLILREGEQVLGEFTADRWARGVNLSTLPKWSLNARSLEAWKKIEEKNRILGLAWLTQVGHQRPDTPKGIPLEEAKKKAAMLDEEIRKLCAPSEVKLRLAPVR